MENTLMTFITAAEAARAKGMSSKGVIKALTEGRLKGGRYKGRYIIDQDSLSRFQPRPYSKCGSSPGPGPLDLRPIHPSRSSEEPTSNPMTP